MNDRSWVRNWFSFPRRFLSLLKRSSPQAVSLIGRLDILKISKKQLKKPQNDIADTAEQQDHHNHSLLLDLPSELVLMVASFLDKEFQLMLSLSCWRIRDLLDSHLDLTLNSDKATKVRSLQLLELDYPELLTCRSCGFLYSWRKMEFFQYHCPHGDRHTVEDTLVSFGQFFKVGGMESVAVMRGLVDLILRAHEQGPNHGVPASFLNTGGHDHRGFSHMHEARLVDGQLILASRISIETGLGQEVETMRRLFLPNVCLHLSATAGIMQKIRGTFEQVFPIMVVGSEESEVFKCPWCETDHQIHVKKCEENRTRMVLNVWRNYGQRYWNKLLNEQIFHRKPVLQLDANALSQRDVRAAFESKTRCILGNEA